MLQKHITDGSPATVIPRPHNGKIGKRVHLCLPPIPLRLSERRLLLGAMDVLIVNAALLETLILRPDSAMAGLVTGMQLRWFVLLSVVWLAMAQVLDIYDLSRSAIARHSAWAAGSNAVVTAVVYLLIPYLTPPLPDSRSGVLLLPALATLGVVAWRVLYARIFVQPAFHQRALVVGAGWAGRTLARAVAGAGEDGGNLYLGTGYEIMGFVDDNPEYAGKNAEGCPVLGTHQDLVRLVRELQPDELVMAITPLHAVHSGLFQAILDCRELGIPITTMASRFERITGRVPVEHAGRDLTVVLSVHESAGHRLYLAGKRLADISAGLVGCLVLVLLSPLVWLANQLTDAKRGDLFYRQERVGQGGKFFNVIKYRSMVMNAEKHTGAVWASENDERVTGVGRLLRKTRLDELPQFWNVLRGEMSLIGPRPERPEFFSQLTQEIPVYRVRHAVKPGITGWAQVKYCYGASVDDALLKLQYDLYYIKHQGLYLDVSILLKTAQVMLGLKGR
jgi:exopolysaccharide biosynthesis polyprenyl glycosylphosphotransferase